MICEGGVRRSWRVRFSVDEQAYPFERTRLTRQRSDHRRRTRRPDRASRRGRHRLGRQFGRGPVTDGFFAAYGAFIVVVLAANAIRVTVLPSFARARRAGRLGGEVAAFFLTLASVAVPLLLIGVIAADEIADLLTGGRGGVARATAAEALPWMLLAAVLQLFAGLAASALAALDDYVTSAAGFVLGSVAGLALILLRVDADGVIVLSYGMALNGAVALGVPLVALALRRARSRCREARCVRRGSRTSPASRRWAPASHCPGAPGDVPDLSAARCTRGGRRAHDLRLRL